MFTKRKSNINLRYKKCIKLSNIKRYFLSQISDFFLSKQKHRLHARANIKAKKVQNAQYQSKQPWLCSNLRNVQKFIH